MPTDCVLTLPVRQNPEHLERDVILGLLAGELGCPREQIADFRLRRFSFDARPRHMTWHAAFEVWEDGEDVVEVTYEVDCKPPSPRGDDAPHVVVVGCGPAGLFCAMDLLRSGARVTLCERGKDVQERRKDIANINRGKAADPESNYCFGEGGAGTYSDGKLFTRSGRKKDVFRVLEELVSFGAPESVLSCWRPHIGSNLLPKVVKRIRRCIEEADGKVCFNTRVDKLLVENGKITGVEVSRDGGGDSESIEADAVVIAAGHSALDTLLAVSEAGAALEAKGFALGVRVEHSQEWLDSIQYHGAEDAVDMPASFYELSAKAGEHGVYSFCMCPGGWVVPSQTTPDRLVVNGMSMAKRDSPYANSGIVVSVNPEDWCGRRGNRWGWGRLIKQAATLSSNQMLHQVVIGAVGGEKINVAEGRLPETPLDDPLFGIRIQIALETIAAIAGGGDNKAPAQTCADFINETGNSHELLASSYLPGLTPADFRNILPHGLAKRLHIGLMAFDQRLEGFASSAGQMIGVETRTSSPVRVRREPESCESVSLKGLYPCGEGAGYAGGIVSAALDGRRVAAGVVAALKLLDHKQTT